MSTLEKIGVDYHEKALGGRIIGAGKYAKFEHWEIECECCGGRMPFNSSWLDRILHIRKCAKHRRREDAEWQKMVNEEISVGR